MGCLALRPKHLIVSPADATWLPICRVEQIDLHSSYTGGIGPILPWKFSWIRMSRHFAGMSGVKKARTRSQTRSVQEL